MTRKTWPALAVAGMLVLTVSPAAAQSRSWLDQARQQMVEEVVVGEGIKNPRVIQAMRDTPRHEFVDAVQRKQAYQDMSLPIGEGQTISAPFVVASMTEALDPQPEDKVLEIGTGSGYQAAVLSPLVKTVYTIEIVESLGKAAAQTLQRLGYQNVQTKVGDGFLGWPEHAPFDKIIVTCSPEKVPPPLVEQLREGGLMVIPVGQRYQQTLYVLRKREGKLESQSLVPTLFVPMTGVAEQRREAPADPANPQVVNGDFEQPPDARGNLPGWYYQRQVFWEADAAAPRGDHFVTFRNRELRRAALMVQGMAVDGRKVVRLDLTAWVRHRQTRSGPERDAMPALVLTFYDELRCEIGVTVAGPFLGDAPWRRVVKAIRVPAAAREAMLRLGLFGATGEISFDDVRVTPILAP